MMNTLTDNHLNKWFTDNNNETKGQLIEIYITPKDVKRVKLLYSGGIVDISKDVFFKTYTEAIDYPPKGAICEGVSYYGVKHLTYSNGDGRYFANIRKKILEGFHAYHTEWESIKIIKLPE